MLARTWALALALSLAGGAGRATPCAADGQGAPPTLSGPITVAQAVDTALANNPALRAAEARLDAADASFVEAVGEESFVASGTLAATSGDMVSTLASPTGVVPESIFAVPRNRALSSQLMLMFPLYTGGRLQSNIEAAEHASLAAVCDFFVAEEEVTLAAKLAYREALRAKAYVQVYEAYVAESEERLRIDQAAYEVGKMPLQYVLRDKAELANAKQMLANAQRDGEIALSDLKTVMGVSLASEIELAEGLSQQPLGATLESLLAMAKEDRPEVGAADEKIAAAVARSQAARSAFRPQVSGVLMAGAVGAEGMRGEGGYTAGVVVGLPLLDSGQRRARVEAAQAMEAELTHERDMLRLQIANEVNKAWLALKAAEASIAAAQQALASAQEDYRVAKLRYEAGKAVNVEVVDAQAALVRARANHIDALYEFNAALDRLERAAGGELRESTEASG